MTLPLMLMPAAPLAVKLLNGLVPPTTPPKTIEPVPALTVSARGVAAASLLIVLVNVTIPALEAMLMSLTKVRAPLKPILPDVLVVVL